MVQDLERAVRALREAALGNYRKRIAAGLRKGEGQLVPSIPRHDDEGPGSTTSYGVTMILKSWYNL
ncbi:hypothetical protein [Methanoregula sp.]|uniref:hypothetical protein n=1 Tax=Methanoregula sp. TaxID=2052170 RepID=UPI003C739F64